MNSILAFFNCINNSDKICLVCSKKIEDKTFIICVRCNIHLHNHCELDTCVSKYYTQCPNCQRCGSLATKIIK